MAHFNSRNIQPTKPYMLTDVVLPKDYSSFLKARVVGQDHAIDDILPSLFAYRAGINPAKRPAGVYMLLGPTGVGKTQTAYAVAEMIHGDAAKVLHIDCGEYQLPHEVAKLIGAPPGYLGHRETPAILGAANVAAYGSDKSQLAVLVFDEIEKANESLYRLLLGIFDKGTLTVGDTKLTSFERTIIFLTSNLGAREMSSKNYNMGFNGPPTNSDKSQLDLTHIGARAVKKHFSPEFVNRLDGILTYGALSKTDIVSIARLLANTMKHEIADRTSNAVLLRFSDQAIQLLATRGFSDEYGAREMKRLLNREIRSQLALLLTSNVQPPHILVHVTTKKKGFVLTPEPINSDVSFLRSAK